MEGELDKCQWAFRNRFDMKMKAMMVALPLTFSLMHGQEVANQKGYILATKEVILPVKEKFKSIENTSMKDGKMSVEVLGQKIDGTMSQSGKEEMIYDFVSKDKIRVTFEKKRSLEKSQMMGQEQDKEEIHPTEGKTIVLDRKEGKWVASLEKGEIAEEDKEKITDTFKKLERNFNENEDLQIYGDKPRKIGETWDVDPKLLPGIDEFEVKGGTMKMTFLEVKKFQGEQCAVLKTNFTINAEINEDEMKGMKVDFEGSGRVVRSLKHLTDYKFTGEMSMKMKGGFEAQPGTVASMTMSGNMTINQRIAKAGAEIKK